jgi:hypothetical protein
LATIKPSTTTSMLMALPLLSLILIRFPLSRE